MAKTKKKKSYVTVTKPKEFLDKTPKATGNKNSVFNRKQN